MCDTTRQLKKGVKEHISACNDNIFNLAKKEKNSNIRHQDKLEQLNN